VGLGDEMYARFSVQPEGSVVTAETVMASSVKMFDLMFELGDWKMRVYQAHMIKMPLPAPRTSEKDNVDSRQPGPARSP
jgi:hypothetical protein